VVIAVMVVAVVLVRFLQHFALVSAFGYQEPARDEKRQPGE
jgi:hypothetical protein